MSFQEISNQMDSDFRIEFIFPDNNLIKGQLAL